MKKRDPRAVPIEEVKNRLIEDGKGIQIIESTYESIGKNAEFICKDGHRWRARAWHVSRGKQGCPHCYELNREAIKNEVMNRPEVKKKHRASMKEVQNRPEVKALIGAKSRANWRRREYKEKHKAGMNRPDVKEKQRINGGWHKAEWFEERGHKKIALYKIEFIYNQKRIEKVGITSKPRVRLNQVDASNLQMISPLEWGTPEFICKREREIKRASRSYSVNMPDDFHGRSECFTQIIDPQIAA